MKMIGSPGSRDRRIIDQSADIDLGELQSDVIHVRTVSVTVYHVCDGWVVGGIRPNAPGHIDRAAWGALGQRGLPPLSHEWQMMLELSCAVGET